VAGRGGRCRNRGRLALDAAGLCPSVKRIWTPSWTALSAVGWCFLLLAAFYAVVDVAGWRRPAFWLVVIGMNSIGGVHDCAPVRGFFHPRLVAHASRRRNVSRRSGGVRAVRQWGARILFFYWLTL